MHNELEVHHLSKVEYYIKVVCEVRIQIVGYDLSAVNFGPIGLVGTPLHVEGDLCVWFVPGAVHVFEVAALYENLKNTQRFIFFFDWSHASFVD